MRDSSPQLSVTEALATLTASKGPRALLITASGGQLQHQPIGHAESVLNLETDLFSHLDAQPLSTAWLERLQAYAGQRLAARADAKRAVGTAIPGSSGWAVAHLQAFQPVEVR